MSKIHSLPTLFNMTRSGSIQQWTILYNHNSYWTESGQYGGKRKLSAKTICVGKNIGKSNETSDQEQTILEASSIWELKKKKGFIESLDDAVESEKFTLQGCLEYYKYVNKIMYPCLAEEKLNGMATYLNTNDFKFYSRMNNYVPALQSIADITTSFKNNLRIQGEFYSPDLSFNEIQSIFTSSVNLKELNGCKFYIYDIYDLSNKKLNTLDRKKLINLLFTEEFLMKYSDYFVIHPHVVCNSKQEYDEYHFKLVDLKKEGTVVKNINSEYQLGKTFFYLKRKEFQDDEFELIDFIEGKGKEANKASKASCKTKSGIHFEAGVNGDDMYRINLLINKKDYIGKSAKIKYFDYSIDGVPLQGKFIGMVNDND